MISSAPHPTLGEQIVLVKDHSGPSNESVNQAITHLMPLERPKLILNLEAIPITDTGKFKRKELRDLIRNQHKYS